MQAMGSLTGERYRSEVLSGGLSDYIIAGEIGSFSTM